MGGLGDHVSDDEVDGFVDAAHDLVVSTLAHPRTVALGHAVVDGFFERFGGYTPGELLAELDLDRATIVTDLVRIAPSFVGGLVETGALEALLRAELAPFYESDVVTDLLGA